MSRFAFLFALFCLVLPCFTEEKKGLELETHRLRPHSVSWAKSKLESFHTFTVFNAHIL